MCGLFTVRTRQTMIFKHALELTDARRFKVYPGELVPTIRLDGEVPTVMPMKWGFRPSWVPSSRICINARSETVATSPMFRQAFRTQRCVIPADGFYEPDHSRPGKHYVWFHRPGEAPFFFPGIWTVFSSEGTAPYENWALLTTEPNSTVGRFHNRMPVVLGTAEAETWLASADEASLQPLLAAARDDMLVARQVGSGLYQLRVDDPAAIDPLPAPH